MSIDLSVMFGLTGKTAVITGGGGDLCSALSLAISGAGARVAILDIRLDKAQAVADAVTGAGGTAAAYACDVLDEMSPRHGRARLALRPEHRFDRLGPFSVELISVTWRAVSTGRIASTRQVMQHVRIAGLNSGEMQ